MKGARAGIAEGARRRRHRPGSLGELLEQRDQGSDARIPEYPAAGDCRVENRPFRRKIGDWNTGHADQRIPIDKHCSGYGCGRIRPGTAVDQERNIEHLD